MISLLVSPGLSHGEQYQIPTWVKNNAKWWSEGQLNDEEFIKGMQFLVTQGIVKIPDTETMSNSQPHVPKWVKNNAKWWSEGTIGDSEFVKGIQYLVQINILKINYPKTMILSSPVFENNGTIPLEFSCDGKNISPPLLISNVPKNASSLALIVDDPDSKSDFVHWVVWNISPTKTTFKTGDAESPQGKNSAGTVGYFGPCPPSGVHRYFFTLYALDTSFYLTTPTRTELQQAIDGHILEKTVLLGKYSRN